MIQTQSLLELVEQRRVFSALLDSPLKQLPVKV